MWNEKDKAKDGLTLISNCKPIKTRKLNTRGEKCQKNY